MPAAEPSIEQDPVAPLQVLIAGAGVAAIETAAALAELAGELVAVTLLAPDAEFVYRPAVAQEPFSDADADAGAGATVGVERYPIAEIAAALGAELISDSLAWCDRRARMVHTESGRELAYDALVMCLGAVARPRSADVLTIDGDPGEALDGLWPEIERGEVRRVAFVVPERPGWPLALYEMALTSAARAADGGHELEVTLLSAERAPLESFGVAASEDVARLLADSGIEFVGSVRCEMPSAEEVIVHPDRGAVARARHGGRADRSAPGKRSLATDRVFTLPELHGPQARGLPGTATGFIPVDRFCRVRGVPRVYAAGDATDFAVKHATIAAQQADVAARSIAALAGAAVVAEPLHPMLEAILHTGRGSYRLSARITGGHPFASELAACAPGAPAAEGPVAHLVPYLEQLTP